MEYIGVITGDIVESREIDPKSRELLYSDLKKFLATLKKDKWINEYELFRGDSFQCVQREKENVALAGILGGSGLSIKRNMDLAATRKPIAVYCSMNINVIINTLSKKPIQNPAFFKPTSCFSNSVAHLSVKSLTR